MKGLNHDSKATSMVYILYVYIHIYIDTPVVHFQYSVVIGITIAKNCYIDFSRHRV